LRPLTTRVRNPCQAGASRSAGARVNGSSTAKVNNRIWGSNFCWLMLPTQTGGPPCPKRALTSQNRRSQRLSGASL